MPQDRMTPALARPSGATLGAFALVVVLGAMGTIAIKLTVSEMDPFWAAGLRFALAGSVLWAVILGAGHPLPRGRALAGSLLFGVLNFGLGLALVYAAMTQVAAGTMQVVGALSPMIVVLLSALHGVERLRAPALVGAAIAFLGTGIVFQDGLGTASLVAMGTLVCGVFFLSEAMVVVKWFPRVHPVVQNAIGQTVGGAMLLVTSAALGEGWALPGQGATIAAFLFLVFTGSVMFLLIVHVIERWTASAASYATVVMPALTVPLAALLLGEAVSAPFIFGCAVIFVGLYVGLFYRGR